MENMNSGYIGYSMSKRAANAYENGEKPISKWNKKNIIDELKAYDNLNIEKIKTLPAKILKKKFLNNVGWHHTSSYLNKTYFYCIKSKEDIEAMNINDDTLEKWKNNIETDEATIHRELFYKALDMSGENNFDETFETLKQTEIVKIV